MNDPTNNISPPPPPSAKEPSFSCDSCLRINANCLGGPICERCSLHGFECIFTPGEGKIADLKNAFSSLLLPGQERPTTPSPLMDKMVLSMQQKEKMQDSESEKRDFQRRGRRGEGCAVCRQLGRRCGGEKPKCWSCHGEGFDCVYDEEEDGPGVAVEVDELKYLRQPKEETPTGPVCDTCKIWKAHCDARIPTCSSCEVRDVECRYNNTNTRFNRPRRISIPKAFQYQDSTPQSYYDSRPSNPNPVYGPTKTWQTPVLPQFLSAYYNTPPLQPRSNSKSKSPTLHPSATSSYPKGQMYSTPSGCMSCFESKSKCISAHSNQPSNSKIDATTCARCTTQGIECKPFPSGTRLLACDSCTKGMKLCTNTKKGLQCDYCEEMGVECSRLSASPSMSPPLPTVLNAERAGKKLEGSSCASCKELDLECDEALPVCFNCNELGTTCVRKDAKARSTEKRIAKMKRDYISACRTCHDKGKKCDMRKPVCLACRRDGLFCKGYSGGADAGESESVSGHGVGGGWVKGSGVEIGANVLIGKGVEINGMKVDGDGNGKAKGNEKKEQEKGVGKVEGDMKKEDELKRDDDWEEITHTEALPEGKPGEFGVLELDE